MKQKLKREAIHLRSKGLSYSEILEKIPVAKSTLSLWLQAVGLSKKQRQRLTEKKLRAISRGWESRRRKRIERTMLIKQQASLEITKIQSNNLWLMGIMLYWAEGAKQKTHDVAQGVSFSNSDPFMVKIFLKWLKNCLKIPAEDISFAIYVHENFKEQKEKLMKYWATVTGFSNNKFDRIYYKKHKLNTNRKNIGESYYGLLRIRIKRSTDLNRKITGWLEGICIRCGVV